MRSCTWSWVPEYHVIVRYIERHRVRVHARDPEEAKRKACEEPTGSGRWWTDAPIVESWHEPEAEVKRLRDA